jgi:hypothetical protein
MRQRGSQPGSRVGCMSRRRARRGKQSPPPWHPYNACLTDAVNTRPSAGCVHCAPALFAFAPANLAQMRARQVMRKRKSLQQARDAGGVTCASRARVRRGRRLRNSRSLAPRPDRACWPFAASRAPKAARRRTNDRGTPLAQCSIRAISTGALAQRRADAHLRSSRAPPTRAKKGREEQDERKGIVPAQKKSRLRLKKVKHPKRRGIDVESARAALCSHLEVAVR